MMSASALVIFVEADGIDGGMHGNGWGDSSSV